MDPHLPSRRRILTSSLPPGANMDCPERACAAGGLPDDPLLEILSRVPAKSLCRFKCVSKAWCGLITDPHHRKKLPQAMEGLFFSAKLAGDGEFDVGNLRFMDLTARSVPLDIDPCFSFLKQLPGRQILAPEDSCNGLMLLEHRPRLYPDDMLGCIVLGYIVFNPTTKHWGTVPPCGCPVVPIYHRFTYLAFDPAISSHFHVIQFQQTESNEEEEVEEIASVHVYSSETGTWNHSQTDWDEQDRQGLKRWQNRDNGKLHAFVNGMLHIVLWNKDLDKYQILVVDVQGKTQGMISLPMEAASDRSIAVQHFIAHSQGLLHAIIQKIDMRSGQVHHLSVWVLQDYDAKEWVQKDTGSLLNLIGEYMFLRRAAAMHQDCNVLFFLQDRDGNKLIVYDMDRNEASVLTIAENKKILAIVAPYVPYFAHSPALTDIDGKCIGS